MDQNSLYTWAGYLYMLETAPPNGRHNHTRANLVTAIRLYLQLNKLPPHGFECRVKELVRNLYTQQGVGNSYLSA